MNVLSTLTAISPIDGRYRNKVESLGSYFSEFALMRYRVLVEVEYLIALIELPLPQLSHVGREIFPSLRNIYLKFNLEHAQQIKQIENTTNHDVKAVEYFIKHQLALLNLAHIEEFVHFGLTSQDVNNTAIPLMLKEACETLLFPQWQLLIAELEKMSITWKDVPMLAYTHGQPASPTRVGKEIKVFSYRLEKQFSALKS
ncbi:MAG: lyase family protein, partial [Flammeovirgaceae bacterium]|nr:lyase family protein [Flammeovirgaceae bacterium]MDW8286694.1 lyase family protein [Flammeovirgaceae bacterium]